MARKCFVCKKELPEGSKLPVCEYHKGVAAEITKKAVLGVTAIALTVRVAASDTVKTITKR
ncbi:MAG: hypothetical protein IKG22_12575 [Atopobiaceae bacterium]|nr:hypothetical protein [Atopobiaceae bacterium]